MLNNGFGKSTFYISGLRITEMKSCNQMKVGMRKVPLAQVSPMALSFVFAIV
jgi:hypothetical protein